MKWVKPKKGTTMETTGKILSPKANRHPEVLPH